MKAGLVTFYHIHHYGALLQAAATERAVERFGWDCEIIDYFVNQDNALFKRPTGLGSAAHDAHTALHYQALSERYRRFEKFSRDHLRISDRRYAMSRQIADNAVYSCFVGDINTDCRAIENQQSWPNRQPFGDRYSLRVTTRKRIHRKMRIRDFDGQCLD